MESRNLDILSNFNLLYIEDDKELAKQTVDVLEDFVENIFHAPTTKKASEILRNNRVDIIITDILLENENGIDYVKLLREQYNINIPTIVTTAYTDTKYLLDAIKLKVENYIVKPINIKELLDNLHDILLPIIQKKEIQKNYNTIKTISAITDSKKVDIVNFIVNNLDEENILNYSYGDIMDETNVSKPTVIKVFRHLSEQGILTKLQNRKYQFCEPKLESY